MAVRSVAVPVRGGSVAGNRRSWTVSSVVVALVAALMSAAQVTAAPSAAAAVNPGPFTVNVADREDVRQSYNQVHEATSAVAPGWTGGSVATCTPGTLSADYLNAALSRTNWFRAMAGVPNVTFTAANNTEAQTGALVLAANNKLDHQPPTTAACWSQLGFDGDHHSNIAFGRPTVASVDGWAYDDDIQAEGHRRNMLDPSITTMGFGMIPAQGAVPDYEAELVLTTPAATRPPVRDGFAAWPPNGFVPYQVVPARWSFSLAGADFSAASVTMTHNGAAVPVTVRCVNPGPSCDQFGEPAITWTPNNAVDGADWPKPAADDPWVVTVTGAKVNGATVGPFTYTATVIDPAVTDATHRPSQPQGPTNPATGSSPTYTVPAVPGATGYQWRTTPVAAGDLFDGAENGAGNVTASVSPAYSPISTVRAASGNASFRLDAQGGATTAPPQQTLTLNRTFLATATSSLSYDRLFFNVNTKAASVDVSIDGGATWQPATATSTENPTGQQDQAFTHRVVDLSGYAGRQFRLRFSLTNTANSWSAGDPTVEPDGWYIDNISVANVQGAAASTLSAVGAQPTFTVAGIQQGSVGIDVRPQFTNPSFGSGFGDWSPVLGVTPVGTTGFTTVTSSANPVNTGTPVTYTATVAPTDNGGTVAFTDNGTTLAGCGAVALTNGRATCTTTYANAVTTPIVATYTGDTSFAGSTSAPLTEVVNGQAFTGGSTTASDSQVTTGQAVTITASVSPTDGGGTVDFYSDSNFNHPIPGCTGVPLTAAGQAICTWTPTDAGNYDLRPRYNGDAAFAPTNLGDSPLRVIQLTTTSLTSSANPATDGQTVFYTATVSPAISLGSVQFTDNGVTLPGCGLTPLDGGGSANCTATISGGGTHAIQAFYSGFAMAAPFSASSSPVLPEVVGGTLTASTTTLASSLNPATVGQAVTFTATVTGGGTGTVSFTDRGNQIVGCTGVALAGGQATCSQTYADTTTHNLAAFYSGDGAVAGSTSAPVSQVVNLATAAAPTATAANLGNQAGQLNLTPPAAAPVAVRGVVEAAAVSTVTGYNVYQGTTPGGESQTPLNASRILATAKGYTVTGLTPGTKYYFVARALNRAGVGAPSAEVSMTATSLPSAPTSVAASGAAESVKVTWAPPSSTGGSAITGYQVFLGKVTKKETLKPVNSSLIASTARSYAVTGLQDGAPYYLIVRAVTAKGSGAASVEVSAVPRTVPSLPLRIRTYAGAASLGVQWAAPDITGGTPITGYNVYRGTTAGGESTTPVNATPLSATTRTYTLTGLTNGTKYYVKVRAINAVGRSGLSAEGSATPTASTTTPGWPGTPTAKAGSTTVTLTWTAPASTGGSAITGYNLYRGTSAGGESATPLNATPLPATARTYTATGLKNSQGYFFVVRAVNARGVGAQSVEATATPQPAATVPGAPARLAAVAGAGKVTLTWTKPIWNGGSAVTGYNVYRGTASGRESATPVNATPLPATTTTYTVSGLTAKTLYYFTVTAVNAVGSSAPREVSARPS